MLTTILRVKFHSRLWSAMETELSTELQLPPSKRIRIDAGETKGDSCSITTENIQDCNDFLTEKDVGITERINHIHQRIFGIIKQRFSDFIVHEISPSGHMAQLTNYNIPDSAHSSVGDLESLISCDDFMKIEALSKTNDKSLHEEINVKDCKESRTAIHKSIKKTFPKLDSRTIDKTTIRIFLRGYESSRRSNWNSQDGDYVKSVLYKENKDISTVINLLTKMLRVKSKGISFAGTKDKRAITSQYITFYRVSPSKLLTINGAELGIKLGNFEYCKEHLKLGDLKGNHFTIVLRDICNDVTDKELKIDDGFCRRVEGIIASLQEKGFINYFGMQRFGTSLVPSHQIGCALLHSKWKEAIDLILKPRPGEPADVQKAREHYQETCDVQETLKLFPANKQSTIEFNILKGIEKNGPTNLLASLYHLPRTIRTMYVHSYQSYIWNKMVSFRFQISDGFRPIPGDLVIKNKSSDKSDSVDVEILTSDTCQLHSLLDVVLPLPGYSVTYPNNPVGEEYHKLLAADGLSSEKFMHRVKDFSLPGSYRYILIKPNDIKWKFLRYNDFKIPLSQSDLSIMAGDSPPSESPDGTKGALQLQFSLPSSSYATMALRELLVTDTSSHAQTILNVEACNGDINKDESVTDKDDV